METNTINEGSKVKDLACWAVSEDPGPAMHSKQLTPGHPFYSVEVTGLGVSKGMKITIRSPDDPADERGKQHQAFGLADLFGDGGELGYISIPEITAEGAELDFHWTPKTIAQVRSENEFAFPPQVDTEVSKALTFVQGLQSKAL